MKKVLSFVLVLSFLLCLGGCGKKDTGKTELSVDIKYYADLGQINNIDFKLGDDADTVKDTLNNEEEHTDDDDFFYYDYETADFTVMTNGTVSCCYKTDNKDDGITHIVSFGDAYGFSHGSVSSEVQSTMANLGYKAEERSAEKGELFFLPSSSTLTVLQYDFEKNTVLFVFEENALSATLIYKK